MFSISYQTWEKVVNTYFDIPTQTLTSYLQWFPFTKCSTRKKLLDKFFFETYIEKGFVITTTDYITVQRNYMQKSNSQYRQSQLISPILYLIIQSICVQIFENIESTRNSEITVFYSGNIGTLCPTYNEDYSEFTKAVLYEKNNFECFIKLDVSNYFPNINIDRLFSLVEKNSQGMSQVDLLMYRELFKYIGNGRYPVIQNSMGTSYLATSVYLADIDNEIYNYLLNHKMISGFKMLRYVDDLYILFNSDASLLNINKLVEEFQKYANTLFHLNELDLNYEKTYFAKSDKISDVFSILFYEEIVNGEEFDVYGLDPEQEKTLLLEFLSAIHQENTENFDLSNKSLMEIIEKVFFLEDSVLSANEVLNRIIYSKQLDFSDDEIKEAILNIADYHVLRTSPKKLLTILLNTRDGYGIRLILSNLFNKARETGWLLNDLDIAITYLLKRQFKHQDLIDALIGQSPENEILNEYINNYCLEDNWKPIINSSLTELVKSTITKLTNQIYFLYVVSKARDDYLAAYSYYKSFFDRITAELEWAETGLNGSPKYHTYYKEKNLKKYYAGIENSDEIIKEAAKFRNFNPINHGSAELISNKATKKQLSDSLKALRKLLISKLNELISNSNVN